MNKSYEEMLWYAGAEIRKNSFIQVTMVYGTTFLVSDGRACKKSGTSKTSYADIKQRIFPSLKGDSPPNEFG